MHSVHPLQTNLIFVIALQTIEKGFIPSILNTRQGNVNTMIDKTQTNIFLSPFY